MSAASSIVGFDFDAAVQPPPFRMQPGLRRIAAGAPQLTPLRAGSRHQREKLAVLSAFADRALQAEAGFDPSPALRALAQEAARSWPAHFAWDGHGARSLGVAVAMGGDDVHVRQHEAGVFGLGDEVLRCVQALAPPWRLAGLLSLAFAEDFAIVDGARATVPWLAVCLPSHWAPQRKVGRHFGDIHAPVADNALLLRAGEQLMRMVCAGERWERFVWTITRHPRLHAHPQAIDEAPWRDDAFADAAMVQAWFRSERQTFIPLVSHQQAIFTIGVDCVSLAEVASSPARARRLHHAIASMSDTVLDYRQLRAVKPALLAWLAHQAAAVDSGIADGTDRAG